MGAKEKKKGMKGTWWLQINGSRKSRITNGGKCEIASRGALKHALGGVSCSCTKMRLVNLSSQVCKSFKEGSSAAI